MTCGNDLNTGSCVCDILVEIARKQRPTPECIGGCEESIRELSGVSTTNYNTIPIQLICGNTQNLILAGTCGTVFVARGFRRFPNGNGGLLQSTSTFFRVNSVDEEKCCADLELLCTADILPAPDAVVCDLTLIPDVTFDRTGICVTVDLNCFCGVVCLPAVNAQIAPLPVVGA